MKQVPKLTVNPFPEHLWEKCVTDVFDVFNRYLTNGFKDTLTQFVLSHKCENTCDENIARH